MSSPSIGPFHRNLMPSPSVPRFNTPGVRFNEGFFFGGPPTQTKPKHTMASLALNLSRLNPTQNIALADQVLAKMDPLPPATPGVPEVTGAKLGYIALTDSAPLIIAAEQGLYAKYGMPDVTVEKQKATRQFIN